MRIDPVSVKVWRIGLAVLFATDTLILPLRLTFGSREFRSGLPVADWTRWLAMTLPAAYVVAAVVVVAAVYFASGRHALGAGVAMLVGQRMLLDALGSLEGVYDESWVHSGAVLVGYVGGLLYARLIGYRRGDHETALHYFGAVGMIAVFAATYVNAGTSKMLDSGTSWADTQTIRLLVLSHMKAGHSNALDGIRQFVASAPWVGHLLSFGTLAVQIGGMFFPWTPTTRFIWGVSFVGFHLGIHVVSGIYFHQAVAIALITGIPWVAIARWLRGRRPLNEPAVLPDPPFGARARPMVALVFGALVLLVVALPTRSHPVELANGVHGPEPYRAPFSIVAVLLLALVGVRLRDVLALAKRRELPAKEPRVWQNLWVSLAAGGIWLAMIGANWGLKAVLGVPSLHTPPHHELPGGSGHRGPPGVGPPGSPQPRPQGPPIRSGE